MSRLILHPMFCLGLALLPFASASAAEVAPKAAAATTPASDQHRVRPYDRLSVQIDSSGVSYRVGSCRVDAAGNLKFKILDTEISAKVDRLTEQDAAQAVAKAFVSVRSPGTPAPVVIVSVLSFDSSSQTVTIQGEVHSVGRFPLPQGGEPLSVLDLLMKVGPTDISDLRNVQITTFGPDGVPHKRIVDCGRTIGPNRPKQNPADYILQANDIVFVPKALPF